MIEEQLLEEQLLTRNPFPGLRPFEMGEEYLFFGRDGHCDALLEKLRTTRFAAVVGSSGSGKSSLVRAGLLSALQSGFMRSAGAHWRIVIFRPGNNPIGNLANALGAPDVFGTGDDEQVAGWSGTIEATLRHSSLGLIETVRRAGIEPRENLLLVVDQFEELYRFQADSMDDDSRDEVSAFVKLLLEAARQNELPIYTVLTVRSEYLGDSAQFWGLPEAINEGQYLIPRMTDDERREAIVGPIRVCGGEITLPLVNRLLNDAGDNPNHLPILQHVLMRTWDCWNQPANNNQPLDIYHYEKVGGMAHALSLHADKAYYELSEADRKIAEKMFKRLTEKSTGKGENRRHATLSEICAVAEAGEEEVIKVIETFRRQGRSFLVPPQGVALEPDTLIDISHESLIGGWERLRDWVEDEAQSARIYQRLAEHAELNKKGEEAPLIEPGLQVALDWRDNYEPTKAWAQRYNFDFELAMNYLDESKRQRDVVVGNKKRQGRIRLITAWIVAFILGGLALIILFFWQKAVSANQQVKNLVELHDAAINGMSNQKAELAIENYKKLIDHYGQSTLEDRNAMQLSIAKWMMITVAKDTNDPNPLAPSNLKAADDAVKTMSPKDARDSYSKQALDYFEQISEQCNEIFNADDRAKFYMDIGDLILSNPYRVPSDASFFYEKANVLWKDLDFKSKQASVLIRKGDALSGLDKQEDIEKAPIKKGDSLSRQDRQEDLEKAIEFYKESIALQLSTNKKPETTEEATKSVSDDRPRADGTPSNKIPDQGPTSKSADKGGVKDNLASTYIKIGSVYKKLKKRQEAIDFYLKAFEISKEMNYEGEQINALLELGGTWLESDPARALEFFKQAVKLFKENNRSVVALIRQIDEKYKGRWNQAIKFYKWLRDIYRAECISKPSEVVPLKVYASTLENLENIYKGMGQSPGKCEAALKNYELKMSNYKYEKNPERLIGSLINKLNHECNKR